MDNLKILHRIRSKHEEFITLASDEVTVSSRVHIADDSIEDSRMSNGQNYGQCNEITVYGEQNIHELQLINAGDPI